MTNSKLPVRSGVGGTAWSAYFQEPGKQGAFFVVFGGTPKIMSGRDPNELLTPSEAARLLGVSADTVRLIADKGRVPVLRTMSGRRLFRRADIELLAAQRRAGSSAVST